MCLLKSVRLVLTIESGYKIEGRQNAHSSLEVWDYMLSLIPNRPL